MLKRQDTALSSSRREMLPPPPPNDQHHHAKSIGCMSGVFHLLSKYQHRHRRKYLTFGKKHEKIVQYPSSTKHDRTNNHTKHGVVQRSPTIQPEIRRSITSAHSPEVGFRSSRALLPRLIVGLPELRPEHNNSAESNNSISWEERRKLMFDLEKCDEDLKQLRKIIEHVRYADRVRSPSPPSVVVKRTVVDENYGGRGDENINYTCIMNEQPSPVSVLDELTRSPLISSIYSVRKTTIKNGRMPIPQTQKGTPRNKDGANFESLFVRKVTNIESKASISPPRWNSKAMIESVEEVCNDIGWGEKREVGRMGLVIQDYICRDLIEEFVKDFLGHSYNYANFYSLPRKLCF